MERNVLAVQEMIWKCSSATEGASRQHFPLTEVANAVGEGDMAGTAARVVRPDMGIDRTNPLGLS